MRIILSIALLLIGTTIAEAGGRQQLLLAGNNCYAPRQQLLLAVDDYCVPRQRVSFDYVPRQRVAFDYVPRQQFASPYPRGRFFAPPPFRFVPRRFFFGAGVGGGLQQNGLINLAF